jgi:hypothetical protein
MQKWQYLAIGTYFVEKTDATLLVNNKLNI